MKIGRTFKQIPDIGDLGQYTLGEVIEGAGHVLIDFGSKDTLEWGYGNYGLVFEVPEGAVHDTDAPDYPIECAFEIEVAKLVAAYYLVDSDVDVEGFRAALDDYGYKNIRILPAEAQARPTGWASSI